MPITTIEKDTTNLTMTIVADFPVPRRRLWDAYADPPPRAPRGGRRRCSRRGTRTEPRSTRGCASSSRRA